MGMSTIKNPVGPEAPKVYWRRRLVLLIGVLAVIAIIVLIIVRPGSSSNVDGAGDAAPASTTAPATPAAAGDTPATEPGAIPAEPAADGQAAPCDAASIVVTPVTDADTYAAGVNPQISISLTNTGTAACSINVCTAQQVYTVTSGSEKYWTSTDCQTAPSDMPTVIAAGATLSSTPFTWDRTRSAADTCASTDRPQVPAGGASYHLDATIGGFTSATSKQFILG